MFRVKIHQRFKVEKKKILIGLILFKVTLSKYKTIWKGKCIKLEKVNCNLPPDGSTYRYAKLSHSPLLFKNCCHIFTDLCHRGFVIICIDRGHPEIIVDVFVA